MVRELTKKFKKTAVYTNVNGDIVSYTSKTAKVKKVILLNNTWKLGDVLLGNITFLILIKT